jgi:hypothetical protein
MDKKQLIEKFNNGELKVLGSTHLTNTGGVAICHIEHGIDDKVFGFIVYGDVKKFFYVKLNYLTDKIVFNVGNMRFDLDQFIRI